MLEMLTEWPTRDSIIYANQVEVALVTLAQLKILALAHLLMPKLL